MAPPGHALPVVFIPPPHLWPQIASAIESLVGSEGVVPRTFAAEGSMPSTPTLAQARATPGRTPAAPLSPPAAPSPGNPDRVSGALEQMESVLPRYRAATLAAQTQCAVLREALSATERERDELAQQVGQGVVLEGTNRE